jgi:hypothetical protein
LKDEGELKMSLLTATMIGAALLGADPEVVTSGPAFTEVTGHARVVSSEIILDETAPVVVEAAPIACEPQPTYACYPAYSYCEPEDDCWCPWCGHDDDCEESCCDRHIQTYCIGPGDFYPHYPYLPAYHGYYYFRPYNHMHVEEAAALVAQMGGDPRAPYSVEFLKRYFPPAPVENPIIPEEDPYPLLEDLLEPKLTIE